MKVLYLILILVFSAYAQSNSCYNHWGGSLYSCTSPDLYKKSCNAQCTTGKVTDRCDVTRCCTYGNGITTGVYPPGLLGSGTQAITHTIDPRNYVEYIELGGNYLWTFDVHDKCRDPNYDTTNSRGQYFYFSWASNNQDYHPQTQSGYTSQTSAGTNSNPIISIDTATGAVTIRVRTADLTCPSDAAYPACPYGPLAYSAERVRLRVRKGTSGSQVYTKDSAPVTFTILAPPTCNNGNTITSTIADPTTIFVADYYATSADTHGTYTPSAGTGGTRYQSGYWHAEFDQTDPTCYPFYYALSAIQSSTTCLGTHSNANTAVAAGTCPLCVAQTAPDFVYQGQLVFPNKGSTIAHAELNTLTGSLVKHYYIPEHTEQFAEYYFHIYARDNNPIPTSAGFTCTPKITLHVCGPRDAHSTLLLQNTSSAAVPLPSGAGLPGSAGVTTNPYNKVQTFYSINPDQDATLTNYFIFAQFMNFDPLCAITKYESVTDSTTWPTTNAVTGMDTIAIEEFNPGWWQFKMNERQTVYNNIQFWIRVTARGDNVRWSSSVHQFSQICGPLSSTLYSEPIEQNKADFAMNVAGQCALCGAATTFRHIFTPVQSNNNACNTIVTKQTTATSPSYPGTAHPAITLGNVPASPYGTFPLVLPGSPYTTNPYVQVNDNTQPQVIQFYIVAEESGGSQFVPTNSVLCTYTITCGPLSTTVTPPSLLPFSASDYYELVQDVSRVYSILQFGNTNTNCALLTDTIVPVSGGTAADYTSTDGISLVTTTSTPANANLEVTVPTIDEVVRFFKFMVHAVADGGANADTLPIKIRLVNCFYTILSLPTYASPQKYGAKDVTDPTPIRFIFTHMASDHWECVTITTKQSVIQQYPGVPNAKISATVANDGTHDYFQVVDNYKVQTINFYIVAQESRLSTFIGSTLNQIEVHCVSTSTTLTSSAILPNQSGKDYYQMIYPNIEYVINNFSGSNNANCPIQYYSIVPISGGTSADFTSTDKKTKVTVNSTIADSQITLHVPVIQENNRYFNFRILAQAEGGATVHSANIRIYKVNCDWEAVQVNSSYVVQAVNYTVNEVTTISIDVSAAFLPVQAECPPIKYKISKITQANSNGQIDHYPESLAYIDDTAILTFSDFTQPLPKYNIYVKASSAYVTETWTADTLAATLEVLDPAHVPANIPPAFAWPLVDQYLNYSSKNNFDNQTLGFNFPDFIDVENSTVTMQITTGFRTQFMKFDNTARRMDFKPYQANQFGKFQLTIKLTDALGSYRTYQYQNVYLSMPPERANITVKAREKWVPPPPADANLKANITDINRDGLVTIQYSAYLDRSRFQVWMANNSGEIQLPKVKFEFKNTTQRRLAQQNQTWSNLTTELEAFYTKEGKLEVISKNLNQSMNISQINSNQQPAQLQMYILPENPDYLQGNNFNLSKLNFTWEIIYFNDTVVLVLLDFDEPNYISAGIKWDHYVFHVYPNSSSMFYSDTIKSEISPDYYTLWHEVPPQIKGWYSHMIIQIAQWLKFFLKLLLWFVVFANLFFLGSMRWYFAFMRTFQIVMHLPMLQVILPTSVIYFYSIVIPVAKWDIFEGWNFGISTLNQFTNRTLTTDDQGDARFGIMQQMQLLGYDSFKTFQNLGSITVFIVVYIAKVVFLGILKMNRLSYGQQRNCQKLYRNLINNLFFYEFYIIVLEPYLVFLISGFLQYEMLKGFTSPSDSIEESRKRQLATETSSSSKTGYYGAKFKNGFTKDGIYATIMLAICLIITPIQFLYYLKHSINMHQRLKFINRYGSLFEDVELRNKWSAAFYLVFIFRRIIYVYLIFNVDSSSSLQLLFLNWMNLIILIYVGINYALGDKYQNRLEMFNELSVCFITFHMYFFTDYVLDKNGQTDENVQYNYGIMMNCFLGYYIYVNIWNILSFSFRRYHLWCIKMWRRVKFNIFEQGVEITENFIEDPLSKHMREHWKKIDPSKTLIEPHFFQIMQEKRKKAANQRKQQNLSIIQEDSAEHSAEVPPTSNEEAQTAQGEPSLQSVKIAQYANSSASYSSWSSSCSCSSSEEEKQPVDDGEKHRKVVVQAKKVIVEKKQAKLNFAEYMDKMNSSFKSSDLPALQQNIINKTTYITNTSTTTHHQINSIITEIEEEEKIQREQKPVKKSTAPKGKYNFGEFMDNMRSEEVQQPASPVHDLHLKAAQDEGSMQQSSFVNSRNITAGTDNVHIINTTANRRAEAIHKDQKVRPLITVASNEHIDRTQPRYNFAAFMDKLEADNQNSRTREEEDSEKSKEKQKRGKLNRGRAKKIIEIDDGDSEASRAEMVQVSNGGNHKRLHAGAGRQYPDADVAKEVAREEARHLQPSNLFNKRGKRASLLEAKGNEQLSRGQKVETMMRNTTANINSATNINDLKTSVFSAVNF